MNINCEQIIVFAFHFKGIVCELPYQAIIPLNQAICHCDIPPWFRNLFGVILMN